MIPIVSIIVPVYNSYPYLAKCLESVISQSFDRWECLLIDDGATDGSGDICDAWAEKDSRFRVFHQENRGVSTARNRGIIEGIGDFIAFIDSDDWVNEDYIADMVNQMDISVGLVVSGLYYESDETTRAFSPTSEIELIYKEQSSKWVQFIGLLYGPYGKLYRKSLISRYKIAFPDSMSLGEDMLFNLDYLRHIEKVKFIPKANYHYWVQDHNTLSRKARNDRFDIEYSLWNARALFFSEKALWNDELKDYMATQLWGIVYDGIFRYGKPSINYLNHVLSIPEIDSMRGSSALFHSSEYIKNAILRRDYLFFYLLRRLKP